jgi:hypothetical protein
MDSITVNEIEYVRVRSGGEIQIVVLERGFVYVGRVALDNDWLTITGAKNIRCWGTRNGLGELVKGPTKETKLDEVGTVRVPMRAVIHLIDVDQVAWKSF